MRYTKEYIDYKKLRMHDYANYGRMLAINSLSTSELVEYFVRSLSESYPYMEFNIVDKGDFNIAIKCNGKDLYKGTYLDFENLFRQSSDLLMEKLKEKLSGEDVS